MHAAFISVHFFLLNNCNSRWAKTIFFASHRDSFLCSSSRLCVCANALIMHVGCGGRGVVGGGGRECNPAIRRHLLLRLLSAVDEQSPVGTFAAPRSHVTYVRQLWSSRRSLPMCSFHPDSVASWLFTGVEFIHWNLEIIFLPNLNNLAAGL